MLINHFSNHKQKYIGFLAVAALTTSGTYLIYKTEALSLPLGSNMRTPNTVSGRPCPPFLRQIRRTFPSKHPCYQENLDRQNKENVVIESAPVVLIEISTTTPTSTPTVDADTSTTTSE